MGNRPRHAAAQEKGEIRSRLRQISTRARAKIINFMEKYGLRSLTERKIIRNSEIKQPPLARKKRREK
jgi:hypothetical protein